MILTPDYLLSVEKVAKLTGTDPKEIHFVKADRNKFKNLLLHKAQGKDASRVFKVAAAAVSVSHSLIVGKGETKVSQCSYTG